MIAAFRYPKFFLIWAGVSPIPMSNSKSFVGDLDFPVQPNRQIIGYAQ